MSVSGGPDIVENGLVLYLDAANRRSYSGSGTAWANIIDGTNNGTLTNGPTFDGGNGGSIVFDGVNDFVDFSDSGLLPTAGLTVSTWYKTSVADKWLVDKAAGNIDSTGYKLISNSDGSLGCFVNATSVGTAAGFIAANAGRWMNIVFTWTPSTSLILYSQGTQLGINTTSIPASINNPSANLRVAGRANNTDYWNGNVAQVSIYNRALSAAEVLQNFNATRSRFNV
jgi:hypothetical protein